LLAEGERFDAAAVADGLSGRGVRARAFPGNASLLESLIADTLPHPGRQRVVVFFTNGSFDGIIGRYASAAKGS
jgi:UDP-N-acetylmuramate: L-alanyl-gamma-D-glutamyl-meso-diaminopimelate ligase